jgi:hypothetical protein
VNVDLSLKKNNLCHTEEEHDIHHAVAEHKGKEAEQLSDMLRDKEGGLEQEHVTLSEARSQLTLKGTAIVEA